MMTELRKCPFCGGEAEGQMVVVSPCKYAVQCLSCGSCLWNSSRSDSIKAWNTRAIEDELVDTLKDMLNLFDRGLPNPSIGRKVCDEVKELLKSIEGGE